MDTLDPKPGYLTTEFWVTVLTVLFAVVATFATLFGKTINKDGLLALVPTLAPIAAGVAAAVYALTRSKTKQAHYAALTQLNVAAPTVVSHGTVNVTPVANADGSLGGGV